MSLIHACVWVCMCVCVRVCTCYAKMIAPVLCYGHTTVLLLSFYVHPVCTTNYTCITTNERVGINGCFFSDYFMSTFRWTRRKLLTALQVHDHDHNTVSLLAQWWKILDSMQTRSSAWQTCRKMTRKMGKENRWWILAGILLLYKKGLSSFFL